MAAASTATAAHAADWKQAHELICALDKTTTCTVPTCPTVTQPTLAAGVATADTEHCLEFDADTDIKLWGMKFYKVQVQGSMMDSTKFKAACTAKHPDLRPICAWSTPNAHTRSVDSNGKQWCLVIQTIAQAKCGRRTNTIFYRQQVVTFGLPAIRCQGTTLTVIMTALLLRPTRTVTPIAQRLPKTPFL